jgi:hypothetical protein
MPYLNSEDQKKWQEENRDKVNANSQRYRKRHPDRRRESNRKWNHKRRERDPDYNKRKCRKYRDKYPERVKEYAQRYRLKLRAEVIGAYGGICVCCGESELAFLTLDHIDGGGTKSRRRHGLGDAYYVHLRKNGFPSGLQILCANCNMAKDRPGGCPHQTEGK